MSIKVNSHGEIHNWYNRYQPGVSDNVPRLEKAINSLVEGVPPLALGHVGFLRINPLQYRPEFLRIPFQFAKKIIEVSQPLQRVRLLSPEVLLCERIGLSTWRRCTRSDSGLSTYSRAVRMSKA